MTILRVAIGAIWVLSFLAGRGVWTPAEPLAIAATSAEITESADPVAGAVADGPLVEDDDPVEPPNPRFDLFGNEIEEAVADYRLDVRGGLYERHSPDTAVSRPRSPVM